MEYSTIEKLVQASGVSPGELILIHFWGDDNDKDIANNFMTAVASLGASPVLLQQSRAINREIFTVAAESAYDDRYYQLFSNFDAVLDVFAYQPVVLGYEIAEPQMDIYRKYMSQLFYKLMECKRFTQIRLPTEANAQGSNLDTQDFIHRMERAYDIDYAALAESCETRLSSLRGVCKVAVHTNHGNILELDITGRTWLADTGDGDLPCGEVYIPPIESGTNGSVFFESLYLDDKKYENVTLSIVNGELVGCSDPDAAKIFEEMPCENRIVCELGIGMNPNVTDLCGYTVLDEKMAGTFHIAIGSNDMFGGKNQASDHIDFVGCGNIEVIK